MNKLIEFFKAKAFQTAITSISVCLVVVVSAGAIVHSNNKKLEAVLNELSNSSTTESVTESSSETTTESTTESSAVTSTTAPKKNTITTTKEAANDKAMQYLAEYERITKEYEKKRAELEECTQLYPCYTLRPFNGPSEEYESYSIEESKLNESNSKNAEKNLESEKVRKQIEELDSKYEKDIEDLKKIYGIIE